MPYLKKLPKKPRKTISENRKERGKIYSTSRWKRLRIEKLREQPLCEECLKKGIIKPASQVHHLDSFMNYKDLERIEKAFDLNNLQSLCVECHSQKHSKGRTSEKRIPETNN